MLVFLASAAAGPPPVRAVEDFVSAGDIRDLSALRAITHEDFRVVAQMPDGISVMDRSTYLGLIESETIGGTPRKGKYQLVVANDDLATVKGTLDSEAAHFDCTWTLVRQDDSWLVVQDAVVFSPRTK